MYIHKSRNMVGTDLDLEYWSISQAVFVPADDLTDPAPATTFAHLDANTVLSRAISELGIYPAVDPLDSTSRIMDVNIVGAEHYNVARGVQKILQVGVVLFWLLLCGCGQIFVLGYGSGLAASLCAVVCIEGWS